MAASVRACWVREQRRRSQGAVATAAATAASRRPPQSCCKQVPPAFCTPFLPGIGGATWCTYALPARCRVPEGSESLPRQASRSASVTVAEREFVIRYSCLIAAREPFKSVTRGRSSRTGDAAILQQAEPYPRRLEGVQKDGCRPPDTGTNLQALPFFSTSGAWMAAPLSKKRLPHRHTTPLAMIL
ncbi:hypothetical protein E2C01_023768 [Portunus trituberculatus]|uniref:Uncharacterized protein n=1 Tax=Portunus trituberculatus TaxID=210409 RepID=A0A5B7E8V0_PORTR|nr:hypothetical protein [Portunus trituberculatus]